MEMFDRPFAPFLAFSQNGEEIHVQSWLQLLGELVTILVLLPAHNLLLFATYYDNSTFSGLTFAFASLSLSSFKSHICPTPEKQLSSVIQILAAVTRIILDSKRHNSAHYFCAAAIMLQCSKCVVVVVREFLKSKTNGYYLSLVQQNLKMKKLSRPISRQSKDGIQAGFTMPHEVNFVEAKFCLRNPLWDTCDDNHATHNRLIIFS